MLLWGAVTLATAFVATPNQLYVARFCWACRGGFFPGVIPVPDVLVPGSAAGPRDGGVPDGRHLRRRVSGPLRGLDHDPLRRLAGPAGWQALFVLEGIPAMLLGLYAWLRLADRPADVAWLDAAEKQALGAALAVEAPARQHTAGCVTC
jgi:hypothetical protein